MWLEEVELTPILLSKISLTRNGDVLNHDLVHLENGDILKVVLESVSIYFQFLYLFCKDKNTYFFLLQFWNSHICDSQNFFQKFVFTKMVTKNIFKFLH